MTREEAYTKHADELIRFATGIVGPSDAADVVTDACLRAFQSKHWETVSSHRAYLYKAVLNQARSHRRSMARRRTREARTAVSERYHTTLTDVDVLAAVEDLSMRQRAAIFLTYWEDQTPAAVADTLGISEGAVKRHLARARRTLKEQLQ